MTNRLQRATTVKTTLILAAAKDLRRMLGKRLQGSLSNREWCWVHEVGVPFVKVLTIWLWKNGYRWRTGFIAANDAKTELRALEEWLDDKYKVKLNPLERIELFSRQVIRGELTMFPVARKGYAWNNGHLRHYIEPDALTVQIWGPESLSIRRRHLHLPKGVFKLFTAWAAGMLSQLSSKAKPAAFGFMNLHKLRQMKKLSAIKQRETEVVVDAETWQKLRETNFNNVNEVINQTKPCPSTKTKSKKSRTS